MLKNLRDTKAATDAMLSILPTSGTLAGIAVGLVSIMDLHADRAVTSYGDDLLVISALGFLMVCYLIFFAVRHIEQPYASRLVLVIDYLFLASLTLVVLSGFVAVYEFI